MSVFKTGGYIPFYDIIFENYKLFSVKAYQSKALKTD